MTTYRSVGSHDQEFIAEMAGLFGQGHGSASGRPWGEHWDYGLVAEEEGESIGAAWYRRHRRLDGVESDESVREVFLAVRPDHQRQGIGTDLWTRLLDAAREDPSVEFLIGMVTSSSAGWSVPKLRTAGFEERKAGKQTTWILGPLATAPQ
jgi:GNAT superfamily N-acetyltransferase